ncbi:MAG: ribonuclease BN (tRNA processing enzyme) [Paraglaciecola sp.]|jgi:ribonuclease BN (tRNA processing enzyme)
MATKMNLIKKLLTALVFCFVNSPLTAHEQVHTATYLGNEAVLVTGTKSKVLFDPFFHRNFGQYQLVPKHIKSAIMQGKTPYDDIDAIVISHAHGDHFAAEEVLSYLQAFPDTKLVAPQQAVDALSELDNSQAIMPQVLSVKLALGDKPIQILVGEITVEAVRIPHAGWPGRADVENLIFRVALDDNLTVMHMGDADANDDHFLPYKTFWQERESDTAFPPYWFFSSAEGNDILDIIINAREHIGVHVPIVVPTSLKKGSKDYFSKPGEKRNVSHQHK